MKTISELRSELESRSAATAVETNFGTELVGRLLSLDEVEMVAGGDTATCFSGTTSYSKAPESSFTQNSGGQFDQTGSGSYGMACNI
jgi:hypothetical protein